MFEDGTLSSTYSCLKYYAKYSQFCCPSERAWGSCSCEKTSYKCYDRVICEPTSAPQKANNIQQLCDSPRPVPGTQTRDPMNNAFGNVTKRGGCGMPTKRPTTEATTSVRAAYASYTRSTQYIIQFTQHHIRATCCVIHATCNLCSNIRCPSTHTVPKPYTASRNNPLARPYLSESVTHASPSRPLKAGTHYVPAFRRPANDTYALAAVSNPSQHYPCSRIPSMLYHTPQALRNKVHGCGRVHTPCYPTRSSLQASSNAFPTSLTVYNISKQRQQRM